MTATVEEVDFDFEAEGGGGGGGVTMEELTSCDRSALMRRRVAIWVERYFSSMERLKIFRSFLADVFGVCI